jgi:hypothetical protein
MAPGDIPPRCVGCFERIAKLEEALAELRTEREKESDRKFEWKKMLVGALVTFALGGGGLVALAKGFGLFK